jgi:signal transduction histidine kinase
MVSFVNRVLLGLLFYLGSAGLCDGQEPYNSVSHLKESVRLAKTDSLRIVAYIYLSNTYLEENQQDSSLWAAEQALKMAEAAKLPLLVGWANYMIGSYFFYEGYYDKGIQLQSLVAQQADALNVQLLRACAQKIIAWIYTEMGKETEALVLFKAGLPVFKKYSKEDMQMSIGIAYYGMATSYFYLARFDSARLYYDSAIAAKPPMDSREMALTLADRASLKRDKFNDLKGALTDAQRAFNLLEKSSLQRDAKAYVQAELALTFAKLGQLNKANEWAQSAYQLYSSIPLLKRYVSVYQTITETFRLTGNFKNAFQSEQETRTLQDSLFEWRKLQTIEGLRLKYQTDIKDKEIANLNLERRLQQSLLVKNQNVLYVLAVSIFIIAVTGIIYNRKREKYHRKIRGLESSQQVRLEKERIAKELHDSLGSQLSTISLGIQRAAQETGNETLVSVQVMTDKAMSELRDSIWAMNKESISLEELEQRINTLFWQYRKIEVPIEMEMKIVGDIGARKLSPDMGAHLYRVCFCCGALPKPRPVPETKC